MDRVSRFAMLHPAFANRPWLTRLIHSPYCWVFPFAVATIWIVSKLAFGGVNLEVQQWVVVTMIIMSLVVAFNRLVGRHIDPEVGTMMMLVGNFMRMAVVLFAVLIGDKTLGEEFPAFCTSTMIGYMYYLLAEIFELVQISRRD